MSESQALAEQMLTLLVMDLGYLGRPQHGHSPIRHQLAWERCAQILGDDVMATEAQIMRYQMAEEAAILQATSVPAKELQKLETSRKELYEFLNVRLTEREMLDIVNITGQIWKVANTKEWR